MIRIILAPVLKSVFKWRNTEFLLEDLDKILCSHETDVDSKFTHIDIGAFQQDAGVLETYVTDELGGSFVG